MKPEPKYKTQMRSYQDCCSGFTVFQGEDVLCLCCLNEYQNWYKISFLGELRNAGGRKQVCNLVLAIWWFYRGVSLFLLLSLIGI